MASDRTNHAGSVEGEYACGRGHSHCVQCGGSRQQVLKASTSHLSATVRLKRDAPALWPGRGDVGVVRGIWLSPADRYEVEFCRPGQSPVCALFDPDLLELVEPESVRTDGDEKGESR